MEGFLFYGIELDAGDAPICERTKLARVIVADKTGAGPARMNQTFVRAQTTADFFVRLLLIIKRFRRLERSQT